MLLFVETQSAQIIFVNPLCAIKTDARCLETSTRKKEKKEKKRRMYYCVSLKCD